MIVDSSALVAILTRESSADQMRAVLAAAERLSLSSASYLETSIVVDNRASSTLSDGLDQLLESYGIQIVAVTAEQARIARAAYRTFGKGSGHPAGLNFGDCFAYALARERNEPLLFVGNDFIHTDLTSALAS